MYHTECTENHRMLKSWENIPKQWGLEQLERGRAEGIAQEQLSQTPPEQDPGHH